MDAYIGSVREFCEGKEEWKQYAEWLNHFILANGMKDEQKKDVFLAVIGPQAYKLLLKSLITPAKHLVSTQNKRTDFVWYRCGQCGHGPS